MFHPRTPLTKYIARRWTLSCIPVAHARVRTNMQIMTQRSDSLSYVRVLANECNCLFSRLPAGAQQLILLLLNQKCVFLVSRGLFSLGQVTEYVFTNLLSLYQASALREKCILYFHAAGSHYYFNGLVYEGCRSGNCNQPFHHWWVRKQVWFDGCSYFLVGIRSGFTSYLILI